MRSPLMAAIGVALFAWSAQAADIDIGYSAPGNLGRLPGVVELCPSTDGSHTAVACPVSGGSGSAATITRSTPSQPAATLLPATAGVVIPYTAGWPSIRYRIQGSDGANGAGGCVTFGSAAPAFSTNPGLPGCAVGFPVYAGSSETRLASRDGVMPTTPLQAIQPPGGALTITYEVQ